MSQQMEKERLNRWVNSSHVLSKFEPFMITVAQGLGRLDVKLIQYDQRFCGLPLEERNTIEEALLFTDHMTLSYLWVLGAYELMRSIDQRCRDKLCLLENQLIEKVKEVKLEFERIRIPLAKFEPSRRHQKTDSAIAFPAIHIEFGASWHISYNKYVSRRELSDTLLDLLENMQK